MFIKSENGDYFPLSKVKRLWIEESNKAIRNWADIEEFGHVPLQAGEIKDITRATFPMIPANPGFFALEKWFDESGEKFTLHKVPIVAWLYTTDLGLTPVTLEGVAHGLDETPPILQPDGSVVIPFAQTFLSLEEYVESQKRDG